SWYDINSEVKYTLTPGTTYKYKFWGTFNGVDVISSTAYSFKTTGTAPAQTYTAKIYLNSDYSALYTKSVTQGQAYGVLPTAYGKDGYTFDGYYTAKTGGTKVTSSTIFNGTSDITLYPRYTQNVVEEPEVPQQYTVYLYMNGYVYKTLTVTNGSTYGTLPSPNLSGYDFLGWYTKVSGGTKITSSTKVNLTGSQTLYARFEEIPEEGGTITLQIGNPRLTVNGVSKPIDDGGTVPVIRNDRTLLPVRAVIEAMDGTVGWDNSTRTVSLTKDGKTLYLQINSTLCVDSSGKYYALDSAPIILNDRTMLPIRFVVEYFGGTVGWNGNTRTVTIQY
ncbi:MAG: InlB B-repeat-containing protein, partial [Ruminiclostridium sp.]|nr:InlB B-repeat-containing protein [Ruminiclostridium sp.]